MITWRLHPILIMGPKLLLRPATEVDSSFIISIRSQHTEAGHISRGSENITEQVNWMKSYKLREQRQEEYYFIIEDHFGTQIGTVRIYDFLNGIFNWGSWILSNNKPQKAALESTLLSMGFAFRVLKFDAGIVSVHPRNSKALGFYRRLEMQEITENEKEIKFLYSKAKFESDLSNLQPILEGNDK